MADTFQVLRWSLERKCPFRQGEAFFLPDTTFPQLFELRIVSWALQKGQVVNGICITNSEMEKDYDGRFVPIPNEGFRIEERFGKYSGMVEVAKTCAACEANATDDPENVFAACHGYLNFAPDSLELEKVLWATIDKHGLGKRLLEHFPMTTPLWFGFWLDSPLKQTQVEFLRDLFEATFDEKDLGEELPGRFLIALRKAVEEKLPLHVSLTPLGHVDLGFYTIFPHCPRCKANAPVGRWKDEYPTEPHDCHVCGFTFIPNETHSCTEEKEEIEFDSLKEMLKKADYDELVRQYRQQNESKWPY